jgi:insulysin
MNISLKYFDIDLPINDKRDIRGITLDNGINIVLISDSNIKNSSCSVGVHAGYLEDKFEGTAHFLEHLLFMGSEKFPSQNMYHSYIQNNGGIDNAFTGDNITCYFLELESNFLEKGIEMLSWFFREPLLDMKHINSEMEIINSEHQKNILSDVWIMDDIFKKFIKKSKYSNFGTGNSDSLKDITKEDIMNFYNTYYTTDNLYVCIVDTIDIKSMNTKYLKYFEEIPSKKYTDKTDRFSKSKLETIDDNLIVFKSISQYKFLNYYIILSCNEHNQIDVQLINFLSYLIGSEYTNSFIYYLKENELANNVRTSVDYFYDYEAILSINITLIKDDIKTFEQIGIYLNLLLNKISELNEEEFKTLYDNYRKINLLHSLYNNRQNASDVSNDIIDNLIKGENCLCVIRKYAVPEFKRTIFEKFKELLEIEIKITTNLNIEKRKDSEYLVSEHYKTKYYITNYEIKTLDTDEVDFNFNNLIIYSDISIKLYPITSSVNKKELPKIIYRTDIREVYLLEYNKYEKPIMNISIIRKNDKFTKKQHNLIISIYRHLCLRILNYYLDTISNYKMYFSMNITDEYLVYNFNGLDYLMKRFINDIVNKTSFYSIVSNSLSSKYFEEIKRDIIDNLINLKYDSPYLLCIRYFSIILSKDFMPNEAIKYIEKLTYNSFLEQLDDLLLFSKETFIIIGNLKNCPDVFSCDDYTHKNALEYVEILTLNSLRYNTYETQLSLMFDTKEKNEQKEEDDKIYNDFNYVLTKQEINPKEINNCLIDCYLVKRYTLQLIDNIIVKKQLREIFKDKLIFGLISELINEPLFDKIRTIDKLGYIVKSTLKYNTNENNAMIFICYIIQSSYKIDDIYKSIDTFNDNFYKKFKKNKSEFKKLFNNLKKSKIMDLEKNPTDLDEECAIYISSIINKYGIFNFIDLNLEILKTITFDDMYTHLEYMFTNIVKSNRYHVILNKDV